MHRELYSYSEYTVCSRLIMQYCITDYSKNAPERYLELLVPAIVYRK